jgi:hypothetical protein
MKKDQVCLLIVLIVAPISSGVAQIANKQQDAPKPHHTIVPFPPTPEAIRSAGIRGFEVVSGDPDKPGASFVIRTYNVENQIVVPHWHPEDEHLTIIKGTWYIGEGNTFDRDPLREMNVGDYVFVPKQMRHFGWAKTVVVTQIHGLGPFKINPVDPWMLLSDVKAASHFKFKLNDRVRSKRGEGLVVSGNYSEKNRIKQYFVLRKDSEPFAELEEELEKVE